MNKPKLDLSAPLAQASKTAQYLIDRSQDDANGCRVWVGTRTSSGYGRAHIAGQAYSAHRLSYTLFCKQVPDGLQLDHLCRNRLCIRPDHLEPVVPRENYLRGVGFTSLNASKTHCPNGHAYDDVRVRSWGTYKSLFRSCRECAREANRRYRARLKLA